MAGEHYKKIKCSVMRADDANDMSDIYVGVDIEGKFMDARIKPGEVVELAQPLYDILANTSIPCSKKVDENGLIRSEMYMRPRYAINVRGIETTGEANKRVAEFTLGQAKELDATKAENELLRKKLAAAEANNAIPDARNNKSNEAAEAKESDEI